MVSLKGLANASTNSSQRATVDRDISLNPKQETEAQRLYEQLQQTFLDEARRFRTLVLLAELLAACKAETSSEIPARSLLVVSHEILAPCCSPWCCGTIRLSSSTRERIVVPGHKSLHVQGSQATKAGGRPGDGGVFLGAVDQILPPAIYNTPRRPGQGAWQRFVTNRTIAFGPPRTGSESKFAFRPERRSRTYRTLV